MASSYRLTCCLCRRTVGQRADLYALDAEWQRRYPDMVGNLACRRCAIDKHTWKCQDETGRCVDGHIRAANLEEIHDFDSWSHIEAEGTRAAMILLYPSSGLLQGAEERVRARARATSGDEALIARAREAVAEWDRAATTGPSRA